MADQTFQFRWISGNRLMERWGMEHAELKQLCDYCNDSGGIQPYYEMPEFGPQGPNGQSTILDWSYHKYGTEDPMNPGFMMTISSNKELEGAIFKLGDVEKFEENHPEMKPHVKTDHRLFLQNGILVDGTAPEKIRIAAEAWQALYKSGRWLEWSKERKGHISEIEKWITKHYPKAENKKLIAKVVNYNVNGALPKRGLSIGKKGNKKKS